MIFAQHGPAWRPKLERFLSNQLIDGVIWDPREEQIARINHIRGENDNYSTIKQMIDLKVYYKQFPLSHVKRLDELEYFPDSEINRKFLRNPDNLITLVKEAIQFQLDFGVDVIVAPSFYLYSFNDRIVDKLLDVSEIFCEQLENAHVEKERYISVIFNESALDSAMYISEFLDDLSDIVHSFNGIYITIDRDQIRHRHDFNPTRLNHMLQLIYDLNNLGVKVIIGYSGIESILYLAVGAYAIGTGWFYSLRNFNREQKGLEPVEGMGRQKRRYTSMNMLFELGIEDKILSIPEHLQDEFYDIIFTGCHLDEKVKEGNVDDIEYNEIYEQYFESMKQVIDILHDKDTLEAKIKFIKEILDKAEDNINKYNDEPEIIRRINGKHVESYKVALDKFIEDNFIIV